VAATSWKRAGELAVDSEPRSYVLLVLVGNVEIINRKPARTPRAEARTPAPEWRSHSDGWERRIAVLPARQCLADFSRQVVWGERLAQERSSQLACHIRGEHLVRVP